MSFEYNIQRVEEIHREFYRLAHRGLLVRLGNDPGKGWEANVFRKVQIRGEDCVTWIFSGCEETIHEAMQKAIDASNAWKLEQQSKLKLKP